MHFNGYSENIKSLTKYSYINKVLGHPYRLKMVQGLLNDECHVSHIVKGLNAPQATVSQHLKLLKSAGILEARREKARICYKVIHPKIKHLMKVLFEE